MDEVKWHGICSTCGTLHGRVPSVEHIMTVSPGRCDWCEKDDVPVADPRDYGYPEPGPNIKARPAP